MKMKNKRGVELSLNVIVIAVIVLVIVVVSIMVFTGIMGDSTKKIYNIFGKMEDHDKDGIEDIMDNCPCEPGKSEYNGCQKSISDMTPDEKKIMMRSDCETKN